MGMHFAPPPPAAISRVLARFNRRQLEGFIAVAIDLLDFADGDLDLEDSEASETKIDERGRYLAYRTLADQAAGDDAGEAEPAWQEWSGRVSRRRRKFAHEPIGTPLAGEDDEDDDIDEGVEDQPFEAEQDLGAEDGGTTEDTEDDVPMVPVFGIEPGPDGQRPYLGIGNLQTSFLPKSGAVRSADSGRLHRWNERADRPGMPV